MGPYPEIAPALRRRGSRSTGPLVLGQVTEHVALLVAATTLHGSPGAQGVANRGLKRLRAVDRDEHAPVGAKPAALQVAERPAADRLVLGNTVRAFRDEVLDALTAAYREAVAGPSP